MKTAFSTPLSVTSTTDPINTPTATVLPDDTLWLNNILVDTDLKWQVHNCKIVQQEVTQDAPLPFLYHYDTLSDELKTAHPLTPDLLKRFDEPMSVQEAQTLLGLSKGSIANPWQVKIIGTLVMFCESLQIAVRLRFTNTAKPLEPVYVSHKDDAITAAMQSWHFFGDVFVLNKCPKALAVLPTDTLSGQYMANSGQSNNSQSNSQSASGEQVNNVQTDTDNQTDNNEQSNIKQNITTNELSYADKQQQMAALVYPLSKHNDYQQLPAIYATALLSTLEDNKTLLPQLDAFIQTRIA